MSGYPIILGGDHAAFEAEWAKGGRPAHERPDWPLPSFDAMDWAKAFCKVADRVDYKDLESHSMIFCRTAPADYLVQLMDATA